MKALSVFRTRIAPRVPGAADILIDQAVLDACIEFCEQSEAVKRMMDPFTTVAGTREYDLDTGVIRIVRAWRGQTEITALDEDGPALPQAFVTTVDGETFRGAPRYVLQTDPGVVALYPTPDAAYVMNLRVATKPTRSATQVEDELFEDHCDTIVNGALSSLYMIPGDFASPALADICGKKFRAGINEALLNARRGVTRAETRIRPVHI